MKIGTWAVQYWVELFFGLLAGAMSAGFAWIWRRIRASQREQNSIKNGIKALLRDRIIQAYNHYHDKGWCPIYGLENVHDMYRQYQTLGGNGTMKRLVEEMEVLPKSKNGEKREKEEYDV